MIGVPDSGIDAAIGFSEATGIPYSKGFVKNNYIGRTFIKPTQEQRELAVRIKLNPIRAIVEGKRVVMIDDSIVRGTTSARIVQLLKQAGATEVPRSDQLAAFPLAMLLRHRYSVDRRADGAAKHDRSD